VKTEQNLATGFYDCAIALPPTQQAAYSEQREVGGSSQVLIGNFYFKTARHLLADTWRD